MEIALNEYVAVTDASSVGEVRRTALLVAQRLGLDETRSGEFALLATEASRNVLVHGNGGEVVLTGAVSMEAIALTEGVFKTMTLTKATIAVAMVLALAVGTGAAGLSDRPSACARPYARFDISISSMKEKSARSAGRISRRPFFGSPSSRMKGTRAPLA